MEESLTPELILKAYRIGFFPMGEEDGTIGWFNPDPRAIIDLHHFHIPKRLQRTLRQGPFEIRIDENFEGVIQGCADRKETWINGPIRSAFTAMSGLGLAHSIEAYQGNRLVGGIYGISLGGAFMGESMFSRKKEASKVCLVHLVQRLIQRGYSLFDIQFLNPHLVRFGAIEISRSDYLIRLDHALKQNCSFIP